jgi:hypothetical protein
LENSILWRQGRFSGKGLQIFTKVINNGHKNTIPIIDNFEELICFRLKLKENLK